MVYTLSLPTLNFNVGVSETKSISDAKQIVANVLKMTESSRI